MFKTTQGGKVTQALVPLPMDVISVQNHSSWKNDASLRSTSKVCDIRRGDARSVGKQ